MKIKITKNQLKIMKEYWKKYQELYNNFFVEVQILENKMSNAVGINDLTFFRVDGEAVGIGNEDRTLELIQRDKLY